MVNRLNRVIPRRSAEQCLSTPDRKGHSLEEFLKWYVVQSKPREEDRAQYFLEEKRLETYLPRMEVITVKACRNIIKQKPLFPGYLFCRFDPKESLAHVRWTKGVAKILPESVNPVSVEDSMVNILRDLEQEDGVIRKKALKKDDSIRVSHGPMKDILGIFEQWTSDQGRVRVLLNFIKYQATVELHHSMVERVTS